MISIVNNYFDKLKTLNNNYELEFNDQLYIDFNKKLLDYDVNKNSKLTNSKVYFILKLNLRKELCNLSSQYINACLNNDDPIISNSPLKFILYDANEYIKYKYDKYMKDHPKFKIISDIETKYNIVNKDIFTVLGDKDEDEKCFSEIK
jgi:hypothetical protein